MSDDFVESASAILASDVPPRAFLAALVAWLDLRLCANTEHETTPEMQLLARALVAAGESHARMPTVATTLAAARMYVAEPTEETFDALQIAATDSYPFGPGDGCYAVSETGYPGCEPGSGCRSGAGCLMSIALAIDDATAAEQIKREVGAWLNAIRAADGLTREPPLPKSGEGSGC